ncbi:(d)CMP kinase, partial [Candidatus Actinomarina]|nr:(d)CMP kinase [Candidatus Actinomarina sp.]
NFFSSGKLYRIIAKYLIDNPQENVNDIFLSIDENLNITLNNILYEDSKLYTKVINLKSSEIAKLREIRKLVSDSLLLLSNNLKNGLIIEGRDMGTVVFPHADLKIYLDADIDIRSDRRLKQSNESETKSDLLKRDENDKNRSESPLKVPDDALYIDNTHMDMEDVLNIVRESLKLL